jgi:hypothetical protein
VKMRESCATDLPSTSSFVLSRSISASGSLSCPHTGLTPSIRFDSIANSSMSKIHDFHDNNSLDCLMLTTYIIYKRLVDRTARNRR